MLKPVDMRPVGKKILLRIKNTLNLLKIIIISVRPTHTVMQSQSENVDQNHLRIVQSCITAIKQNRQQSFFNYCVWILQYYVSQWYTEYFQLLRVHICSFVHGFPFGKCASSLTRYWMGLALRRPVKVWGGVQSTGQGDPLTWKKHFLPLSPSLTPALQFRLSL